MQVTVQFRSGAQSLNANVKAFLFMYFVYILYSKDYDRYYIGQCEDINARIQRHNKGQVPSTKAYVSWEIAYTENFISRAFACKREKEIKNKKSRKYIEFLVNKK